MSIRQKLVRFIFVGLLCCFVNIETTHSQSKECRADIPTDGSYVVRSIRVKSRRWGVPSVDVSLFQADQIKNKVSNRDNLAAKIKKAEDPISLYIKGKLSAETLALLNSYDRTQPIPENLLKALATDLNKILSDAALFDNERFAALKLTCGAMDEGERQQLLNIYQRMVGKYTQGDDLIRLNRLLLEEHYCQTLITQSSQVLLLTKDGDRYSDSNFSDMKLVHRALNAETKNNDEEFVKFGKFPVFDLRTVTRCVTEVEESVCRNENLGDKCVDIQLRPYSIGVDAIKVGSNFLPIPRSNKFNFLSSVPKPLRILNPQFSLTQDSEAGTQPSFEISTDLLTMPEIMSDKKAKPRNVSLLFKATGGKSLNEPFYNTSAGLKLSMKNPKGIFESFNFESSFAAVRQPQGINQLFQNTLNLGGSVELKPHWKLFHKDAVVQRLMIEGNYRYTNNRLVSDTANASITTNENAFAGRIFLEGRIKNGFTRAIFWADKAKPENFTKGYGRFAGLIGYENEIGVKSQSIGLELIGGFGRAYGEVPEYARFFGGNSMKNFLYDDTSDNTLKIFPSGPLLRSFGQNQAGKNSVNTNQGANTFQHFNITVSIPISKLSRRLIPDEVVIEDVDPPVRLPQVMKAQALVSGKNNLAVWLEDKIREAEPNLSDEEVEEKADREAEKVIDEIAPAVNYLADRAKIYAVKPLFMFDAARSKFLNETNYRTRYGVGGGLQLTVVIAKFEIGYVRTVQRQPGDPKGNFITRLVFQNLF